jgi:hypothetical protein
VGQDSVSTEEAFGSVTRFSNPTFVGYRRNYWFLLAFFLAWHPCLGHSLRIIKQFHSFVSFFHQLWLDVFVCYQHFHIFNELLLIASTPFLVAPLALEQLGHDVFDQLTSESDLFCETVNK